MPKQQLFLVQCPAHWPVLGSGVAMGEKEGGVAIASHRNTTGPSHNLPGQGRQALDARAQVWQSGEAGSKTTNSEPSLSNKVRRAGNVTEKMSD